MMPQRKSRPGRAASPNLPNNNNAQTDKPNQAARQEPWRARVPDSYWKLQIPSRPFRTLGVLLKHSDKRGECFPEIATLAAGTGTHHTNVYRDLRDLRNRYRVLAWIERKTPSGRATSHRFRILLPEFNAARRSVTADTEIVTRDNQIVTGNKEIVTGNALTTTELSTERASHKTRARDGREGRAEERSAPPWDFEQWWAAYPHKVGKPKAEQAYGRARQHTDPQTLLDAAKRYGATKPPDRHWLNPATWLHDQRWLDSPAAQDYRPPRVEERTPTAAERAELSRRLLGDDDDDDTTTPKEKIA
jgi:hypothetical protein